MKNSFRESLGYRLSTPSLLLYTVFSYSLGIGLAHHLGASLDWFNVWLGLLLCFLLVEMGNLLNAYFDHPLSAITTLSRSEPLFQKLLLVKRGTLLQYALLVLTAGAMLTVLVAFRGALNVSMLIYLGLAFLLCFFSVVPPLRLKVKGYGELAEAILIAFLFPALGLSMQGESSQILLVMLTLPLVLIYLGRGIVHGLKTYGHDETRDKKTLVTMLGWQRCVQAHNLSLLTAFLFVGVFILIGLPWRLGWPILLGLPVAIYQVYLVILLAEGGKPRWQLLLFISTTLFLLETYLISLTLWIR